MTPDIQADLIREAIASAEDPQTEAVVVLVASRDPAIIEKAGPRLCAMLWPGDRFGGVLWHEPAAAPEWSAGELWSEVAVEKRRPRDITPTAGAVSPPPGSRS